MLGFDSGTVSEQKSTPEEIRRRHPWEKAYEQLQRDKDFSKHLRDHEKYIESRTSPSTATNPTADNTLKTLPSDSPDKRFEHLQTWAKKEFETLPSRYFVIPVVSLEGETKRKIVVRHKARRAVNYIQKFQPVVSAALSAQPIAGLVWGGVWLSYRYVLRISISLTDQRLVISHQF